jgi:hypothetical protein
MDELSEVPEVRVLRLQPDDLLLVRVSDYGAIDQVREVVKAALPAGLADRVKVVLHTDDVELTVVRENGTDVG